MISTIVQPLVALVALALLLLIPGYLLLAVAERRDLTARRGIVVSSTMVVLASVLLSSWWGLTLAELGIFSLPAHLIGIGAISLALALAAIRRGRLTPGMPAVSLADVAAIGVLLIGLALYVPPGQAIFGNQDAGVHFDSGIKLARTGSFLVHYEQSFSSYGEATAERNASMPPGVLISQPESSTYAPQFAGVFEVWIALFAEMFGWWSVSSISQQALGYALGGLTASTPLVFFVTPIFGLLGLASVYSCARVAFSTRVGLTAMLLLAVSLPMVWFARLPMAEVQTQFFFFGGLTAFALASMTNNRGLYLIAGGAFGLAPLIHIDALLLYLPCGIWLLWLLVSKRWQPSHTFFFAPLGALGIQAVAHYLLVSWEYAHSTAAFLLVEYRSLLFPIAIASALALAILLLLHRNPRIRARVSESLEHLAPRVAFPFAILILLAAIYAYFLRPIMAPPREAYSVFARQVLQSDTGANLVKLGWYVSPLGIALGTLGVCWVIIRRLTRLTWLLVALALMYAVAFVENAHITDLQFFWVRRFLPVVIPALFIFAGATLWNTRKKGRRGRQLGLARLAVAGILLLLVAWPTPVALRSPQFANSVPQMSAFAALVPDDAWVIFEQSDAGKILSTPLLLMYGRRPVILSSHQPNETWVRETLRPWSRQGNGVYYVSQVGNRTIDDTESAFIPVGRAELNYQEMELSYGRLPTTNANVRLRVDVFKVVPRSAPKPPAVYPFELDLSNSGYGYLLNGFYAVEGQAPGMFRQTNGNAALVLPWNPRGQEAILKLSLFQSRPDGVLPGTTRVYVGEHLIGEFTLPRLSESGGASIVRELRFQSDIVDRKIGTTNVTIVSDPWVPAEYGLGDTRKLGVAIQRIELRDSP